MLLVSMAMCLEIGVLFLNSFKRDRVMNCLKNEMGLGRTVVRVLMVSLLGASLVGCSTPSGKTRAEKRASVQRMRELTLNKLYSLKPDTQQEVKNAVGVGVFSTFGAQLIITTTSNGYGIVRNNKTGKETYMRGFRAGGGLGIGVKDARVVAIFNDEKVLNDFVTKGWTFDAKGEVVGKVGGKGGDLISEKLLFGGKIKVYLHTEQGVLAGASLGGSKVWVDKDLN
jgi:lipid-binding SYLF domain-containing protein